jgi:acyl-CoA reductase-like NAD-dependent aldehyde dehydrogenase
MSLHGNLIDGRWTGGEVCENINYSDTDDIVGEYVLGAPEDAKNAVAGARLAQPVWPTCQSLLAQRLSRKLASKFWRDGTTSRSYWRATRAKSAALSGGRLS